MDASGSSQGRVHIVAHGRLGLFGRERGQQHGRGIGHGRQLLHGHGARRVRNPFRAARWPLRAAMTRLGIVGITMPWGKVYLLQPWMRCGWLKRHELVHLRQIQADGPVVFTLRYFWWLALYGYRNNPYEIEAYAAASPPGE